MASTYSSLKIELITTGEQAGTWGITTNTNLGTAIEEAITGSADVPFSSADVTLTLTDTNASQTARNLRLNLTGTSGGARSLIVPAIEKQYIVYNGLADAVTVKNSTGTGISVPAGKTMVVFNNATNVLDATTYLSSLTLGSALPVASGGTGLTSGTSGGVLYYSATGTLASSGVLAASSLVLGGGAGAAPSTTTTGTGVLTALGVNVGTAGAFVVNGGALGTPSSGTVTNLTGTASININGTVGATTANTGAFTSVTSTSASGILTRAAATQDGIELIGRAGGTTSLKVTLTPTTLTASRTITFPDANINFTTGLPVANGGTGLTSGTSGGVLYYSAAGTLASSAALAANALVLGGGAGVAPSTTTTGTGVVTALGINTGTAGAFIVNGGALGTPSSGTLTNVTGLPLSTGITGTLGTTNGGTGLTSFTANGLLYASSTSALATGSTLTFDGTTFTAPNSVITSSSSSDALRITQTGTGNALLVEDSANPDSTPFVIDQSGLNIQGHTAAINFINPANATMQPVLRAGVSVSSTTLHDAQAIYATSNPTIAAPYKIFARSNTTTIGSQAIVSSGDLIGGNSWQASDGTNFVEAARISSFVDGTPGTGSMPGRLVFSTTASGSSTPTERMRIDSAGRLLIGTTSVAFSGTAVTIGWNPTGGVNSAIAIFNGTIQSDVTNSFRGFNSIPNTQAAAFTLSSLYHFYAQQGTFGATSAVTNQYGFLAESTLTGATNNFGFYGNIASGTGRWNLYMAGTADNYMAGRLGLGTTSLTDRIVGVSNAITGATTAYGVVVNGSIQSDVTAAVQVYRSSPATAAAAFTLPTLAHFYATQGTIGSTSAVTNQYGIFVESTLTGATNNYGFYGNIASGTGRWNLYMNGTADNYLNGSLGIGSAPVAGTSLRVGKGITGATNAYQIQSLGTIASDVTSLAVGVLSQLNTAASAFTITNLRNFLASAGSVGASSVITNQYGYVADSTLTVATNNYGFYGDIASGSNRWNLYMNGTAENYLAGNLKIGGTAARGTTAGTNQVALFDGTAPAGTLTNGVSLYSSSGDLNFMDATGAGYKVGFRNVPVNSQSAAYTTVLADSGKFIFHPSTDANARTFTIPANGTVPYDIGTVLTFVNMTSQVVTIAITTDTMYLAGIGSTGSRSLAQYGMATAIKMTSTTWLISGTGLT